MEYRQTPITLDKCFLEQQAFKEFLGLPLEELLPKIGLRDLLKVAKLVIKNELVACGFSEDELLGIRLKYQVGENQPTEVYAVEWGQLIESPQTTGNNNQVSKEKIENNLGGNTKTFYETMGQLTSRLSDFSLASEKGTLMSTHFCFRSSNNLIHTIKCYENSYYAVLDQDNKFLGWHCVNGERIRCGVDPSRLPILL